MAMAQIFKPMRRQPPPDAVDTEESGASRANRVGIQPVTNTSPPGPSLPDLAPAPTQEEGWLALLEIVFAETGWPDA